MTSIDHYAALTAKALVSLGLSRREAVSVVQNREATVRDGHARHASAASVAKKIFSRRGHSGGMTPTVSQAAGCKYVPIEGFLLDDPSDLPPLDHCPTLSRTVAKAGRAGPRPGRAGPKTDDESLFQSDSLRSEKQAMMAYRKISGDLFDRVIPLEEFEALYSAKVATGSQRATVSQVRVFSNGFAIEMLLRMHDGKFGEISRIFTKTVRGVHRVEHSLYMLDGTSAGPNDRSNRGLGAVVTKKSLLWYLDNGLHEVTTTAAWVGRYVWASFGFDWSDDDERSNRLEWLPRYIIKRPYPFTGDKDHAWVGRYDTDKPKGGEFDSGFEERQLKHEVRSLKHSWNLSSLWLKYTEPKGPPAAALSENNVASSTLAENGYMHVGKNYLMGVGEGYVKVDGEREMGEQPWEGVIRLEDGEPSFERARQRLKF